MWQFGVVAEQGGFGARGKIKNLRNFCPGFDLNECLVRFGLVATVDFLLRHLPGVYQN